MFFIAPLAVFDGGVGVQRSVDVHLDHVQLLDVSKALRLFLVYIEFNTHEDFVCPVAQLIVDETGADAVLQQLVESVGFYESFQTALGSGPRRGKEGGGERNVQKLADSGHF
jgi:hypothetical protein